MSAYLVERLMSEKKSIERYCRRNIKEIIVIRDVIGFGNGYVSGIQRIFMGILNG